MTSPTARDEAPLARAVALAPRAISDHPECFWTRAPRAPLDSREDIVLVIRRLRQRGSSHTWACARVVEPPVG